MEREKINVHVTNNTGDVILVEFRDPYKIANYSKYQETAKIHPAEANAQESTTIDADKQSRFFQKIKPSGTFTVHNFATEQEIFASRAGLDVPRAYMEIYSKPYLISAKLNDIWSKPGTKEISVGLREPEAVRGWLPWGASKPTKWEWYLTSEVSVSAKPLAELEKFELPVVKTLPGHEASIKTLKKEEKKEETEKERLQKEKVAYENLKKTRIDQISTLGIWGTLIPLLFDKDLKTISEDRIYETLGFKGKPTAEQLFDPKSFGDATLSARVVYRKLLSIFGQDANLSRNTYSIEQLQGKIQTLHTLLHERAKELK